MPSSISVGATESAKSTTNLANCLTFMIYLASSVSALMIFVHLATCNGCSFCSVCLSAARSHKAGGAKPVSDSLMPVSSLTLLIIVWMSSSTVFMDFVYWPWPCTKFVRETWIKRFVVVYLRMFSRVGCPLHRELYRWIKVRLSGVIFAKVATILPFISFSGSSLSSFIFRMSSPKWSGILNDFWTEYEE